MEEESKKLDHDKEELIKQFKCNLCNAEYTYKGNLQKHIESFHDGKRYDCAICDKSFKQKGNLKYHVESIHEEYLATFQREDKEKNETVFEAESICSDIELKIEPGSEKSESIFSVPEKKKVVITNSKKTSNIFSCNMCSSKFTTENFVFKHIEMVHNKNKCPICKYTFENQDSLKRHFELDHPFQTIKDLTSKTIKDLTSTHENETYRCSICQINFSRAGYLKKHYETSHKELNYAGPKSGQNSAQNDGQNSGHLKCGSCNFKTSWHSVLKRHIKSEHGNLLFKCVFCIYFCKSKDELLAHVKMSHPEMQNNPKQSLATLGNPLKRIKSQHENLQFKCISCTYICKSKDKILEHMKMSHPEITKEVSNPDNLTPTSSKLLQP